MHLASIIHILGFLLTSLGFALLLPLTVSWYCDSGDHFGFLIAAALAISCGLLAYKTTHLDHDLRAREGFAVATFTWALFPLFGCLPFVISGTIPTFTDAFFETMSGFSTTGATILNDIESLPAGTLFWRSLTQWIGGMGIIVLSLAVLPFLGVGGMQLFKAEIPGPVVEKLTPRITETARILWTVYVALTAVVAILLFLGGMNIFDAVCHSFTTMASGGFSTRNASIGSFDSAYIDAVTIFFMIITGTNFTLHYRFLQRDFKSHLQNSEFLFFLSVISLATLAIGIDTYSNHYSTIIASLRKTLFQVVAILTNTGYTTADYGGWSLPSQLILFTLMFIGGCAGSTGGGIKVMRIYLLTRFVFSEFTRLIHPRAIVPVRLGKTPIPSEVVANVLGFFILFVFVFITGVLVMSTLGLDLTTSVGATAATLSNVGPGLGSVGPTQTYAHIPAPGKWILSFMMLIGRLELFTVIILVSPAYWKK